MSTSTIKRWSKAENSHDEWVLFIHDAFVNHKMFQSQIEYFENKYNILVLDIIGHGLSVDTKKGDSIDKMSMWKATEPDCTVKIFKDAGHCVNMDVPQAFNESLEEFWKSRHHAAR